jgi:hypothetical protein
MNVKIDSDAFPTATAIDIPATITKCGCGKKELDINHQLPDGTMIHLCPTPLSTETILLAAWRKNKIANAWVNLKIIFRRKGFSWLRF